MLGLALGVGLLHILPQPGTELGVGAVLNQDMGPLVGRQAPQIRQALLGDDDLGVVLRVIHVGHVGHNAGDGAVLGGGGGGEMAMPELRA